MIFRKKNKDEFFEAFNFSYTDLTAIEEYLTLKEKEGLRLKEIDGERMVFEKNEPREDIRYCAEIYSGALKDDFIASCEQEGWINCGVYHDELYIFRTQENDITDIMTDETQKMKTIKKRALLKPGNFYWFFILILRTLNFTMDVDLGLNESNIVYWLSWIIIAFSAYLPACITINYLMWLIKAKTALSRGEKVTYINLKSVKIREVAKCIIFLILSLGSLAFICVADAGYFEDSYLSYWLVMTPVGVAVYSIITKISSKTAYGKAKKILTFILIMAVIISGTFLLSKTSVENFKNTSEIYNTTSIPLSLSDLGYDEEDCTDECVRNNITRFAQHYFYSSDYDETVTHAQIDNSYEAISEYMSYEIFVSDYPHIREKYINKILKKYKKYDYEIEAVNGEKTSWDMLYKDISSENKNYYAGTAVKGDTILYVRWPVNTNGTDLFETAYEKLFANITFSPDGSFDRQQENYYQDKYQSVYDKEVVEMQEMTNSPLEE